MSTVREFLNNKHTDQHPVTVLGMHHNGGSENGGMDVGNSGDVKKSSSDHSLKSKSGIYIHCPNIFQLWL